MDPISISAIVVASTALVGVAGKLLHTLRHNIKSCWGINFRSRSNSPESKKNTDNQRGVDIRAIENDARVDIDLVFPQQKTIRAIAC